MTITLYAKVIKIDSDLSEHHVEGFYNVKEMES